MNFWQKTKRFFEPVSSNIWVYFWLAGIATSFGVGSAYIQIYAIDVFVRLFSENEIYKFPQFAVIFLCIITGGILVAFSLRFYAWIVPQFGMNKYLVNLYMKRFLEADNNQFERIGTGRMISVLQGMHSWSMLLNEVTNNIFRWSIMLIMGSILLGRVNSYFAFLFLGLFIFLLINITYCVNRAHVWRAKRKDAHVEESRKFVRAMMAKFEILQSSNTQKEIKGIENNIDLRAFYSKKATKWDFGSWQFSRLVIAFFTVGICTIFYRQGLRDGITPMLIAEVGTVFGFMATFNAYFHILTEWYLNFLKEIIHVEKLWDTFDKLNPIENYKIGENFFFKQGNFDIKHLNFSYNNSTEVLSHFSLSIQGGKRTALVGRSGSGKTTLMKLLAGYMAPTSGELLIDGQDIAHIRLDSYYPHIGYLTQEPSVFDGTIEENLLYGAKNKPTKKDIERAIELSECQFIYELEHDIKTEIGERGVRLSGGQKQRLAIAKIFLKNPEIILLDEPTAALDSYSEEKVARAFEHLFEGRTVIVIAHRLQTVKSADDIIVLEKGKIVERGTHRQLLKLGGKYAGMVDLQSGVVKEEDNEEGYEK